MSLGSSDQALERWLRAEYVAATIKRDETRLGAWLAAIVAHLEGKAPDLDLPQAVVPRVAADGAAAANSPSSVGPALAAANDERGWEATLVALRRGDQSLRLGDIVSARRFYEFAAAGGITEAATALGQTYDPAYLKSAGVRGVKANAETARGWYEKAAQQGDSRAAQLLQSLAQN